MTLTDALLLTLAVTMFAYLVYALFRPERF